MQLPNDTFDVLSIGQAATQLQVMPGRLSEIAMAMGITPVGRINGILFFNSHDIERILQHVRESSPAGTAPQQPTY